MGPTGQRFRFSFEADIFVLCKVREQDPYKAPRLWCAIAEQLSRTLGKPVSARAVRERCDLLLAHFTKDDRGNLRKSGPEERCGEREQLLGEIFDMARSHGYRIRPSAAKKAAGTSGSLSRASSQPSSRIDRAERRTTSVARDLAAASLRAEPESRNGFTGFGQQRNLGSPRASDTGLLVTSPPEGSRQLLDELSQSPVLQTPSAKEGSVTGLRETSSKAGHVAAMFAQRAPNEGKRNADRCLEFLERRLTLEAETRQREAAQEDRRLAIEERRLALQESQLQLDIGVHLQRVREFEEAHETRRQERAMLSQQNELLANVLRALVEKLAK